MLHIQETRTTSESEDDCATGMAAITRSEPSFWFVFVKHAIVPDEHYMNINTIGTTD